MSMIATEATVHLMHVTTPVVAADPILGNVAADSHLQAEQGFAALRERLACDGVTFENVLRDGNASEALIAHAKAVDADLIVLATHGYGFLRRAVLGSVAADLVRRAPCSLLIVPGSARTLAAARAQAGGADDHA
jgi:nucleotide-binding universal stress UspA family protein